MIPSASCIRNCAHTSVLRWYGHAFMTSSTATTTTNISGNNGGLVLSEPKTVSVIGVPLAKGQTRPGVNHGPAVIRHGGLYQMIQSCGWGVRDCGDITSTSTDLRVSMDHPNARHSYTVGNCNEQLADTVYTEATKGHFCLTLGGDHSIAIGSIAGILRARPKTGVIWVDAHADINTHETSPSGNIHGMSVAYLMKLDQSPIVTGFEWLTQVPTLNADQIVYIGLRDVDEGERHYLQRHNIKCFSMHHIDKYGIGSVMDMSLEYLQRKYADSVHMSIDIDSVDPFLAPSTGTKVRGGLSYREAHYVCESVAATGCLGSVDMVEVNPYLHTDPPTHSIRDQILRRFGIAKIESVVEMEKRLTSHASETVDMALGMIGSCLGKDILK